MNNILIISLFFIVFIPARAFNSHLGKRQHEENSPPTKRIKFNTEDILLKRELDYTSTDLNEFIKNEDFIEISRSFLKNYSTVIFTQERLLQWINCNIDNENQKKILEVLDIEYDTPAGCLSSKDAYFQAFSAIDMTSNNGLSEDLSAISLELFNEILAQDTDTTPYDFLQFINQGMQFMNDYTDHYYHPYTESLIPDKKNQALASLHIFIDNFWQNIFSYNVDFYDESLFNYLIEAQYFLSSASRNLSAYNARNKDGEKLEKKASRFLSFLTQINKNFLAMNTQQKSKCIINSKILLNDHISDSKYSLAVILSTSNSEHLSLPFKHHFLDACENFDCNTVIYLIEKIEQEACAEEVLDVFVKISSIVKNYSLNSVFSTTLSCLKTVPKDVLFNFIDKIFVLKIEPEDLYSLILSYTHLYEQKDELHQKNINFFLKLLDSIESRYFYIVSAATMSIDYINNTDLKDICNKIPLDWKSTNMVLENALREIDEVDVALPDDVFPSVFAFMFKYFECIKSNEKDRENIFDFWKKTLISPDQKRANVVANFILLFSNQLSLDIDGELVQNAILVLNNEKNGNTPYKVYNHLKKESIQQFNLKLLLPFLESKIFIDPDFLQWLSLNTIDESSVPNVTTAEINNLFEEFTKRFFANHDLAEIINQLIAENFEKIINKSLLKYLFGLIESPNSISEKKIALMLKCIIKKCLDLSNSCDGSGLSEREEYLLKAMYTINNCSVGKNAGISQVYDLLDVNQKLKNKTNQIFSSLAADKNLHMMHDASLFLYQIVQDYIDKIFIHCDPLLNHIFPGENFGEIHHDSLHLKNLIGNTVGSRFSLTFDRTSLYSNEKTLLLNKEDALRAFYDFIHKNIDSLIEYVGNKINEKLLTDEHFFRHLSPMLTNNALWIYNFDDESGKSDFKGLSKEGTVEVLLKLGLLVKKELNSF